MAGGVESLGRHTGLAGEPVQREVPGESVSPFVQQRLDGLVLPHVVIEPDHEPGLLPAALPQARAGHPRGPDDHWSRGRAVCPEAIQHLPERLPPRPPEEALVVVAR